MSEPTQGIGEIAWTDLTVENAGEVRDFYQEVVGWTASDHDMGSYFDYDMSQPDNGKTVAGVCHARGANAALPPQWLIYITVQNLDESLARCEQLGGEIIAPPKGAGEGRYAVIRDPAGAVAALFEPRR